MIASSLVEGGDASTFQSQARDNTISSGFSAYLLQRIVSTTSNPEENDSTSVLELDSHADSPIVGRKAFLIRRTGKRVNLYGFTDRLGKPIPVDVVDTAVLYDCEYTGRT